MRYSTGVNGLTVLTLSALLGWSCGVSANDSPAGLARDRQSTAQALKEKNPQRAIKIIEPWFKKRPDDIEIANDYAITLAQLGRLDQAREVLEQALSKNQQTSLAFQNLREILSQQAAISYAKAMGKKPPNQQVALKGGVTTAEAPVVVAQADSRSEPMGPIAASSPVTASKADTRVAADSSAKAEAARESDLK